jgi:hypothetical protein
MWKAVLAGTAALAIAGSTLVYAQQRGDRPDGPRRGAPSAEEMQAFANARLAALRAGLALTPEQLANWPAFEEAAREMQKLRLDRMTALQEQRSNAQPQSTDPAERLRRRGTAMADTGAALKKLADAVEPLYKSLDDNQKRRFAALSRITDPREFFAARDSRDHDRRDARGRDDRGGRFGRDFRDDREGRDFRDGRGDRFGGRDDRRDGPDFRGDRFGGRDLRDRPDFRGDRFGRDFRDDRDRGGRNFRGRDDDRRGGRDGYRDRDGRGSYAREPEEYQREPRERPFGGRRFGRDD